MSYTVFTRKYRPKIFSDLIGQPHIKDTLTNAITTNRLAQAYLFAGSRGTGKTTTARILAKCLNCSEGISITPCCKCSSCEEIANGISLDVIEIDGASNRGIDEIRELREKVKFLPAKAKYKVYIIDEVHMLTKEAFNALLKTLEEPPSHVIFIFATTEPHKVPETILSRCQRFDFKRIPVSEICRELKKIALSEKIEIDDLTLSFIARASEGSMRDAESILDQVVSYCGNKVTQEDVETILGLVKQEVLVTFCEAIIKAELNKIIKLLNDLVDEGISLIQFVRDMMIHLRNLLLIKTGCSSNTLLDLTEDNIKLLEIQSSQFTIDQLLTIINELQKANENMRLFPLQARLILEITLIKIIQGDKKEKSNLEELKEKTISSTPLPIEQVTQSLTTEDSKVSLQQVREVWIEVRKNIKKEKPSLEPYLATAELIDLVNHTLTIRFKEEDPFHKKRIERREIKKFLEEQIKKILNYDLRIKPVFINVKSSTKEETTTKTTVLDMVLKVFPEAEIIPKEVESRK